MSSIIGDRPDRASDPARRVDLFDWPDPDQERLPMLNPLVHGAVGMKNGMKVDLFDWPAPKRTKKSR